jgi:hypothetical protein
MGCGMVLMTVIDLSYRVWKPIYGSFEQNCSLFADMHFAVPQIKTSHWTSIYGIKWQIFDSKDRVSLLDA